MPLIQECYDIKSPPGSVFDLINDVENTSNFSDVLRNVQSIGPDLYRYTIILAGIPLTWVAKVTERVPPQRISWESKSDISLAGSFILTPSSAGTHMDFEMRYNIRNRILAILLKPILPAIIRNVARDTVQSIKERLERNF